MQRRVTVIVGLGMFFDLFDVFLASVLGTVLTRSFGLDRAQVPLVLASGFIGMFAGALAMGPVADRFGRRRAYLVNLGIYSAFTLAGAFSINAGMLMVLRFLAGIGIGAQLPLSDAYLCEVLPADRRGRLISWAYTIAFVGIPAAGLLARVLVPISPLGIDGWRWMFVLGSLGGSLIWASQRALPESPRWLTAVGRHREAAAVTRMLAGDDAAAPALPQTTAGARPPRAPFGVLFSSAYRGRTLMLYVFQVFQTVGYYGFGTLVPIVLAAKGFSVLSSLSYTTIAFLGYPIGSALSVPVVERIDRKWLIIAAAVLMAVFGLALGNATTPALIVAYGFLYTLVSNVFSNALHIFQGEIFPTAVRATAASSAYSLSRASSAAAPFVLLPVLNTYGATVMFGVVAFAMLIVVIDIGLFAPSTTGRALEEIAADTAPVK